MGQSRAKKVFRALSSYDQFMTHKLQVVDTHGNVLLALTRPAKILKSRMIVQDAVGRDPLRSLVVASALGVDTALKQNARGFG